MRLLSRRLVPLLLALLCVLVSGDGAAQQQNGVVVPGDRVRRAGDTMRGPLLLQPAGNVCALQLQRNDKLCIDGNSLTTSAIYTDSAGNFYLQATSNVIVLGPVLTPNTDNTTANGASGTRWSNVFSVLGNFSGTLTNSSAGGYSSTYTAGAALFTSATAATGGTDTAFLLNSSVTLSTVDVLLDLKNNSTSKFQVIGNGDVNASGYLNSRTGRFLTDSNGSGIQIQGYATANGSGKSVSIGNVNALTSGDKILSLTNGASMAGEVCAVMNNGDYNWTVASTGVTHTITGTAGIAGGGNAGDTIAVTAPAGAAATGGASNGGTGGTVSVTGGAGGAALNPSSSGVGGPATITGGAGGAGDAVAAAGAGAVVTIKSGAGGTNGGGGGAASGAVTIDTGAASGSATNGAITIGGTNANGVTLGRAGTVANTLFNGKAGDTKTAGQITLNGGTPGTGTATVLSGAICVCSNSSGVLAIRCSVSGTTLTATGGAAESSVINYICL